VPVFYMFLIVWLKTQDRRVRIFAVLSAGLAALFPFLVSDRSGLGYVIIGGLIAACQLGRLRYGQVIVSATVLLVVFGAMRGMRDDSMQDATYLNEVVTHGKMFEDLVANRNFACVSKTARIYRDTPENMPREYGATLMIWTIAWIPRTIWTSKPEISLGDRVQHEIYHDPIGGGYPPGLVGELIINFGMLGALVGSFAYGAALRWFYNSFRPALAANQTVLLLYICLVIEISFVMMGLQVARVVMDLLKVLFTSAVFLYFASTVARPARAGAEAPRGLETLGAT